MRTAHQQPSGLLSGRSNGNPLEEKSSCPPNFPPQNVISDTFAFGDLVHTEIISVIRGYKQILTSAYCRLYTVLLAWVKDVNKTQSLPEGAHTITEKGQSEYCNAVKYVLTSESDVF